MFAFQMAIGVDINFPGNVDVNMGGDDAGYIIRDMPQIFLTEIIFSIPYKLGELTGFCTIGFSGMDRNPVFPPAEFSAQPVHFIAEELTV
jgi:hypothetical protein